MKRYRVYYTVQRGRDIEVDSDSGGEVAKRKAHLEVLMGLKPGEWVSIDSFIVEVMEDGE